jgi:hypothetical protein
MADNIFNPVEEWGEKDGDCLFFKLDAGEPPTVTNPNCSDWDEGYFTHFMRLPRALQYTDDYIQACRDSGIVSTLDRSTDATPEGGGR